MPGLRFPIFFYAIVTGNDSNGRLAIGKRMIRGLSWKLAIGNWQKNDSWTFVEIGNRQWQLAIGKRPEF
jgi:hypothetical protein